MKIKRPYNQVMPVAEMVMDRLRSACERIEFAGSLRRQRPMVGDIEIVAVPILCRDMFDHPTGESMVDRVLASWEGVILDIGGCRYKKFYVADKGNVHQVDLFLQPDTATWGVNFMIRTGSAAFSKKMVTPKSKKGFMPDQYRVNLAKVFTGGPGINNISILDTPEEEDIFELWGMDWVPPQEREITT